MARPKIESEARTVVVSVRMTPALAESFDHVAQRWGLSRAESMLRLVRAQIEHDAKSRPPTPKPRADVEPRLKTK